ncbi:MAG: hypothetical protein LQ345_003852 [Seirophora villosa]|nr:MAG: hypothetical protein LQ345_003852 [Seirophora villosa]
MEPESHDAAQSRRYEAAESMLQHARMPRTQQSALNGFPKAYPLGSDSSQQLNHRPAVPLTPYPDYTMAIHHPRAGQAPVYNPLSDARLDSPQDASPQHDQHDRHVLVGQQHAYATVSSDNDIRQLTSRGLHTQHDPVKQSNIAEDGEPRSPVSSRGIAAKESATRKRSMRTLGQKAGKKDSALKQEGDNPPPWSELKTKAGKERKRLPLACIACRRKKIRCSGERPACKHCFRSRTPCVYKVTPRKAAPRTDYMAMLDKRLKRMEERVIRLIPEDRANGIPATGRAQVRPLATGLGNKAQGAKKRAAGEAFGPDLEAWATSRVSKPSTQGRGTGQTTPPAEGSDRLPSKEIQEHLADVYFECLYGQSYLLLHKPSFMKRLSAGTAPPVLVLAICAIAARFSTHPQISSEPAFLRGEQWAAPAREIALKRYDQPSITILTVLLILGLHEFGTCRGGRSWMFGGMAMRMAYALQLHRELDSDLKLSATDREIRRRTMWACFMMDRFNSSGTERPTCASEDDLKIQLPNKEFNFRNDVPGPTETLELGSFNPSSLEAESEISPRDNMGVAAYIVRVIVLWGRVIRYLNLGGKEKDSHDLWHPRSDFGELRRQAEEFKGSLPSELQYNADNLATQATEKLGNQFLFLHISYNQVVLFLHRYSIPTIPGAVAADDIPGSFLSASAQAATEAADQISELISHATEHNVYAPFVGYCAFTSGTVHISSTFSNRPRVQASAQRNLGINLEFIRRMKRYWGMCHFMDDNLRDLWQRHQDHALRKNSSGAEVRKPDASLFQYGDWFQKYPHGVSETDYEDAAIQVKEEGVQEATSLKLDLGGAEDFFKQTSPPRPPQLYRKPIRRQSKPAPVHPRPHPPQVLPPDARLEAAAQSMVPMGPPFRLHPPQTLYSTMLPQTYDSLGPAPEMGLLPNLDRNLVYNAYAGTSGPSVPSTDALFQPMGMGEQSTGMWEQAMGEVNGQAQAIGGMGSYMGDFQQSSAWLMPFNMPPPTVFFGEGQDGYGGYGMGSNGGDGMGTGGDGGGGEQ